jgi:hypothetical protein
MAKTPSKKPSAPSGQDSEMMPLHKRLAMGQNPNTGAGSGGGVKAKP